MKKYITIVLIALFALFLTFLGGARYGKKMAEPLIQIDTLLRVDTIRIEKPTPYAVRVTDTIRVEVPIERVQYLRDTIRVALPFEEKVYKDSTYRAQVSGYKPTLDWVEVYPKTEMITIRESLRRKPWGVGVSLGYGVSKAGLTPYVGIGLNYNIINF